MVGGGLILHARNRPDRTVPELGSSGRTPDGAERTPDDPGRGSDADGEATHSIEEFGAIEGEDTRQIARRNREAIQAAAREAGTNGTVYVPEGHYYFGDADISSQLRFGSSEPSGVSFKGAGPHKSSLIFSSTVDPDASYRGFRYDESDDSGNIVDHGEVSIRDLRFDGNYEQLDINEGRTVWGINAYGKGKFVLENVWVRGWWANATRFAGASVDIIGCRYEENAIGVAQVGDRKTAGHHISARPSADSTITVEDSVFLRCSGTVINRRDGDGEAILRRVWVRGVGYGCLKLSNTDSETTLQNIHYNPRTRWMTRNLPDEFDMDGRWFLYRVTGEEYTPTVVLNNVLAAGLSRSFILCLGDTSIELKGTMIAVHDTAGSDSVDAAVRGDTGIDFDIGTVSIHGTGGTVFDAPESTGSIGELRRSGNRGLGEIGDASVVDNPGADPLRPDIVRRQNVGIDFPNGR